MKVARWGNSLAVRLPAALVETLGLKEGDEVELTLKSAGAVEVSRDQERERIIEEIRRLRKPLPPGFKFNREEAHLRGSQEKRTEKNQGAAAD